MVQYHVTLMAREEGEYETSAQPQSGWLRYIYIFIHISNNVKLKIFHSMHSIIVLSFFLFKGYVLYYL